MTIEEELRDEYYERQKFQKGELQNSTTLSAKGSKPNNWFLIIILMLSPLILGIDSHSLTNLILSLFLLAYDRK